MSYQSHVDVGKEVKDIAEEFKSSKEVKNCCQGSVAKSANKTTP